jgi:glycosyltransferase involved in cell wall biosynthesis
LSLPESLPVSAVIPAFNRASLLPRALGSVAAQVAPPTEVIVVDDSSSDGTAEIAGRHGARVLRHERNRGVSAARNTGVANACEPWVAFLDSDDEWLPYHLERLWPLTSGPVLVAASALWIQPRADARLHGVMGAAPRMLHDPSPLVADNFVALSAAMVRKDVFHAVGGFDEDFEYGEDLDLWLRLLERGEGVVSPTVSVLYHLHGGQATDDIRRQHEGHLRVVHRYAGRPWWRERELRRFEVTAAWDSYRRADRSAAAWLARSPMRLVRLAVLLAGRARRRRYTRRTALRSVPA